VAGTFGRVHELEAGKEQASMAAGGEDAELVVELVLELRLGLVLRHKQLGIEAERAEQGNGVSRAWRSDLPSRTPTTTTACAPDLSSAHGDAALIKPFTRFLRTAGRVRVLVHSFQLGATRKL